MKKSDLWIPCNFENRRPILLDQFLYVPDAYDRHDVFQMPSFFPFDGPLQIEYCSGNGQWICQKASENPEINWIAVEKKFARARKIWLKMKKSGLKNLFVIYGEALIFTKYYLKKKSIEKAYINFPDPWPKRRDAKHRLIQKEFVSELSEVLLEKGCAALITDDMEYKDQITHVFRKAQWRPVIETAEVPSNFGDSYFASLWKSKGKKIYYMKYEKAS